jgi:hypothetical protein
MLLHEAEELPAGNFTQKIVKALKSGFQGLSFTLNKESRITIVDSVKNLKLSLDKEENVTYDNNRRALRAADDVKLSAICRKLHKCVQNILRKLYRNDERYEAFNVYNKKIASALLTLKGAQRQPVHCDTSEVEGISALLAMNGPFKFILVQNSVQLIRRIAQMRAQWLNCGRPVPEGISRDDATQVERWFDDSVYAQLVREGWGSSKQLKTSTIIVPEGAALVFSTWLMHAGNEYTDEDIQLFNRVHLYMLPYNMTYRYNTTNMHRTRVEETGLSFSAALNFLPRAQAPLGPEPAPLPYLFRGI